MNAKNDMTSSQSLPQRTFSVPNEITVFQETVMPGIRTYAEDSSRYKCMEENAEFLSLNEQHLRDYM